MPEAKLAAAATAKTRSIKLLIVCGIENQARAIISSSRIMDRSRQESLLMLLTFRAMGEVVQHQANKVGRSDVTRDQTAAIPVACHVLQNEGVKRRNRVQPIMMMMIQSINQNQMRMLMIIR